MLCDGLGRVVGIVDAGAGDVAGEPAERVVTGSPGITSDLQLLASKAAGQQIR